MLQTKLLIILLLVGAISAVPTPENEDDEKTIITKQFYNKNFISYRGEHEIVNILVPTNSLNFDENDDTEIETFDDTNLYVFFVEADVAANGEREDKGLYVLYKGVATKLLEHGRDVAASSDDSKDVFFAAQDGIYIYDVKENKAVKYGSVNDDVIAIAKENGTDVIYYLNKDHELYKVSKCGQKVVKVDDVIGAQEIALDYENNLYYYTKDKELYVKTGSSVKKVEGLPEHPTDVKLIRPLFVMEDNVIYLSNNEYYIVYSNGTSEPSDFSIELRSKPSAYSMDATFIQFYGFRKNLYKFNILKLLSSDDLKDLAKFLDDNETSVQNAATRKLSKKQ